MSDEMRLNLIFVQSFYTIETKDNMVRKLGITLGIGVDIIKTNRFKELLLSKGKLNSRFTSRISSRILHPEFELPKFNEFKDNNKLNECISLISGSWASKEAVYKTLDDEYQRQFQFKNWYKYYNEQGKPFIRSDFYKKENEEFQLSVSHDDGLLVATVLRQEIYELTNEDL